MKRGASRRRARVAKPRPKTTRAKRVVPEFGAEALAKLMNLEPANVRVKLRAAKVKKTGRYYDFKSKAGLQKMAKQLAR